MEIQALALTDIGRVKPSNEDTFLIDQDLRLYIVADGMGGHAAGEVASQMAIEEVQRFVQQHRDRVDQFIQTSEGRERVLEVLEHAVRHAGQLIYQTGQAQPEKRGMGTTCSLLLLTPRRGFIAHVGDSRVYLSRQDEVVQLTEDHSLINELIKRGRLRPEDAARAPYRNAVTRAVGVHADVQVDTMSFELAAGDRFVLCSDGLVEYLRTDGEIVEVLKKHTFNDAPRAFIELANARGGKDNITALIVHFAGAGKTPTQEDIALKLTALRRMPLFQHLEYVELMAVLNICRLVNYSAGGEIFREGDPGTEMYVVLGGLVRILKGDVELAQVGKGGHFGEMSIMDKGPRSAAATAQAATTLIVVGRRPLFRLMRENKDIAVKLLWCFVQVLNQRLRITNDDLKQALAPLELDAMFGEEDED
ncbi:MAG: Stp1/IreP family PP2C-type Ser/Thr phosphatase [Myxococcales bacterium]|nr:Stp1/IreP family PP2C-type Ser/Thr phosphatase [Myxococcales bacterium]